MSERPETRDPERTGRDRAGDDAPARGGAETGATAGAAPQDEALRERVIEALKSVYDPEIPVDIYELGLIYEVRVDPDGHVVIVMTLTTPHCPVAGSLPAEVEGRVLAVEGVSSCHVELVWDPPWTQDRMSEAARLQLGLI